MNNILILIPDELKKPMGGMGEQARNMLDVFPPNYVFNVIGSANSEEFRNRNYHYYPVMKMNTLDGNPEPFSLTYLNQSLFIEKALSLSDKPDIVHAFDWSAFWAGRIIAQHYNIPLVVTMQLSIEKQIEHPHYLQVLSYQMACAIEISGLIEANAIIQVSESYAKLFPFILLPKTTIIHNGINSNEWVSKTKVKLPGDNPIKLVYIGRYAEMKNIQTLIQCKIPNEIDLIFIGTTSGGNSELFDAMVDFCNKTENAYFVGAKYGQEKIDWLMTADAIIIPSIHEPFGIVALEALASKSILLSSFVNGMGDFLTEDYAINCGTTVNSIELAFQKLINLSQEDKQKYIDAGIKICDNHTWSCQAEKLSKVYDSVLKR